MIFPIQILFWILFSLQKYVQCIVLGVSLLLSRLFHNIIHIYGILPNWTDTTHTKLAFVYIVEHVSEEEMMKLKFLYFTTRSNVCVDYLIYMPAFPKYVVVIKSTNSSIERIALLFAIFFTSSVNVCLGPCNFPLLCKMYNFFH